MASSQMEEQWLMRPIRAPRAVGTVMVNNFAMVLIEQNDPKWSILGMNF